MPPMVIAMAVASAMPWHRRSLARWVVSAPAQFQVASLACNVADMAVGSGRLLQEPSGVGADPELDLVYRMPS